MGSVKQDQVAIRTATRRERAVELRRDGKTLPEIARELGVNKSTVHRLLKKAFAAVPSVAVDEVRTLLGARYERIAEITAKHMSSDDPDVALQAAGVATRNNRALAALHGLESSETRIKPITPPSSSAFNLAGLEPVELPFVAKLLERLQGKTTHAELVAAARSFLEVVDLEANAVPVATRQPIGLLPPAHPTAAEVLGEDEPPLELE